MEEEKKTKSDHGLSRRAFVERSSMALIGAGWAAAGLGLGTRGAYAQGAPAQELSPIPQVVLGKTKLKVTRIGCGGTAMRDPLAAEAAVNAGMTLVHTAGGYTGGESLPAFGKIMPEWRDKVVLCVKDPPDKIPDLLAALNTDHVEISIPAAQSVEAVQNVQLKESFERMRDKGVVKFLGFACHKSMTDVVKASIDAGFYDCMLISYSDPTDEFLAAIEEAKKAGMGIISMKGMRQRRRRNAPPEEEAAQETTEVRVRRMLFEQHADTVLASVSTPENAKEYAQIGYDLRKAIEPSEKVKEELSRLDRELMATCGFCGSCDGCPRGVDICAIQRYMIYRDHYGRIEEAAYKYRRLDRNKTVLNCIDCGQCEQRCPRNLPVRAMLRTAHDTLA